MSSITPGVSPLASAFPAGTPLLSLRHGDGPEVVAHSTGNVTDAASSAHVGRIAQADWQGARFITNGDETGSALVQHEGRTAMVEVDHALRFPVQHRTEAGFTVTHFQSPSSWSPLNDAVQGAYDAKGLQLLREMPAVPVVPGVIDEATGGGIGRLGKVGMAVGVGAALAGAAGLGVWLAKRD